MLHSAFAHHGWRIKMRNMGCREPQKRKGILHLIFQQFLFVGQGFQLRALFHQRFILPLQVSLMSQDAAKLVSHLAFPEMLITMSLKNVDVANANEKCRDSLFSCCKRVLAKHNPEKDQLLYGFAERDVETKRQHRIELHPGTATVLLVSLQTTH